MLSKAKSEKILSENLHSQKKRGEYISGRYSNLADNLNRKHGGVIETEILRKPVDIRDDTKYMGQTEVIIKNVPMFTVDEKTSVNDDSVREWVLYAISEEDPHSQYFYDEIQRLTMAIGEVETKLKKIPKIVFADENGTPFSDEKAKEERIKLFEKYGAERTDAENALEDIDRELKEHIAWRKTMGVNLFRGEEDANARTCTWHMTLADAPDCEEIEELLLMKQNWSGIKLATSFVDEKEEKIPPWAGRGELPDGSNLVMPNYSKYQVNMLGVMIERIPKGVGLYQQLDRQSGSIAGPEFIMYYGEYDLGKKQGYGIETTDQGVYAGEFSAGRRWGRGRMDYADGTTVVGNFGLNMHNPLQSKGFQNPYLSDENRGWDPNGEVEIFYADGAYYKGKMVNGVVTGTGDYQSAFDEIRSGQFRNGRLHGEKGFLHTAANDVYLGRFREGELHGPGTFLNEEGDAYEGYFEHGMRHGRGVYTSGGDVDIHIAGCYRGYYVNNLKHGRGSLEYELLTPTEQIHLQTEKARQRELKVKQAISNRAKKKLFGPQGAKSQTNNNDDVTSDDEDNHVDNKATKKSFDELEDDELDRILTPYGHMFQGIFMANSIMNQGSILPTATQVPSIISRLDKRRIYSINQVLKHESRSSKRAEKEMEKLQAVEVSLRQTLMEKKRRIFNQQKHFTKKTMYNLDVYEIFNERELKQRTLAREDRLKKMNFEKHPYKKALIPRLRNMNNSLMTAYMKSFDNVRPQNGDIRSDEMIPEEFVKLALSNMEEAKERQRFLKYDVLWQRAEDAFFDAQKGILPSFVSTR
jgi:hypothetical protein